MASNTPGPSLPTFTHEDYQELMIVSKCLELTFDLNVTEFTLPSGDFDDIAIEVKYVDGKEKKLALLKHDDETEAYEENQENTKQLENQIINEFIWIHGTEDTFHRFTDFIRRWRRNKKDKLNKKVVTIKIVEALLSPFVKTITHDLYYTDFGDMLRRAILSFRLTTFEETSEVIHKIWIKNTNEPEVFKNFLLAESAVKDENLKGQEYSLISWHLGQSPLILEVTTDSKAAIFEAVELLKTNGIEDRKLLLLRQKEELSGCFRNLNSLKNVNHAVYREILENFSCSLQGRLHKLEEIIDSEDFEKIINLDCLVKMTTDSNFNVGGKPELPEFYIPMVLPRILVHFKFLQEEKTEDLILIGCNGKKEQVKKILKDIRTVDVEWLLSDDRGLFAKSLRETTSDNCKKIICLHPLEFSSKECSEVMKKISARNCHHFNFREEYVDLEWINTRGDVKGLRSYVSAKKIFEKEDEFLHKNRRTINVVCAEPGVGKTTMLKHFYYLKNESRWLLHLTAREHASSITKDTDVRNFVLSLASDNLERNFIEAFYGTRKIVFMWDGLNEVLDHAQRHKIYRFVENIQQFGFVQFITSRCNLQEEIEEEFETFARRIEEVTKFEQSEFLRNRLSKKYTDEQLAAITETSHKILGFPFQLYLMTDLLLQTDIDSVINEPLTILLEHFVNNRFKNEDAFIKKTSIRSYKLLGIKICLESIIELNFFDESELSDLAAIEAGDDRFGFVKKLGRVSVFILQSFAEYFAALFLATNYRRIRNFQKVYFDGRCRNLRFMLDLILARDCSAHTAVLCKDLKTLEDHKDDILREDAAGRNALHIALSWGKEDLALPGIDVDIDLQLLGRILKFLMEDNAELVNAFDKMFDRDYFWYSNESFLEMGVVTNDVNVVKFIYSLRGMENDGLSLIYAATIGNLDICKFLTNNGAKVNYSTNSTTPLIEAAARGYLDMAKFLIYNTADVNMTGADEQSPLFYAVCNNQLSVVQLLVENSADVNLPSKKGSTPLSVAAMKGYLEIIQILINNDADVNMADCEGRNPLFCAVLGNLKPVVQLLIDNNAEVNSSALLTAAAQGHVDTIKILIDNGAELNGSEGQSPLFLAVIDNRLPMVQFLIENSAKVNITNKNDVTPMMVAAQHGCLDIAKILIDNGAEVNMTDGYGESALFFAVVYHQLPLAQLLIEHGAEVNLPNKNGTTPLIMAAQRGHLYSAKILIDNKAEINMTDSDGESALFFAVWYDYLPMVQLLVENNAEVNLPNQLIMAARNGYLDIAKVLIDSKSEVDMTDGEGQSPLFFAACNNELLVVQLLLENNADLNLAAKNGTTPLIMAAQEGHLDIAEILIYNKAEVNKTDLEGQSPLFYAAGYNHLPVVQLFIENNAEVNLPTKEGATPLIVAAYNGYLEIAKFLINNMAKMDMADSEGGSPLFFAVANNQLPIVQLLINNEANINHQSQYGTTPLMVACDRSYFEIIDFLLKKNAELDFEDNDGNTALHFSVRNNNLDIIKLLVQKGANVNSKNGRGQTPLELADLSPEVKDYLMSINVKAVKKPSSCSRNSKLLTISGVLTSFFGSLIFGIFELMN